MSVNPPEPDNFIEKELPAETVQVTHEHENTAYLGDVQNVQAELHAANVEGRAPNFEGYNDATLRAAGVDPEKAKAGADAPEEEQVQYLKDENGEDIVDADGNRTVDPNPPERASDIQATNDVLLTNPQYLDNGVHQTPIVNGPNNDNVVNEIPEQPIYKLDDEQQEAVDKAEADRNDAVKEQQETADVLDFSSAQTQDEEVSDTDPHLVETVKAVQTNEVSANNLGAEVNLKGEPENKDEDSESGHVNVSGLEVLDPDANNPFKDHDITAGADHAITGDPELGPENE